MWPGLLLNGPVRAYHEIDHLEPDAPTFKPALAIDPGKLKAIQDAMNPPAPAPKNPSLQQSADPLTTQPQQQPIPLNKNPEAFKASPTANPNLKSKSGQTPAKKTKASQPEQVNKGTATGGGNNDNNGGGYSPLGYEAPSNGGLSLGQQPLPQEVLSKRQGSIIEGGGFKFQPLSTEPAGRTPARDSDHEPGEINVAAASMVDAQTIARFLDQNGFRLLRRRNLKNLGMVFSTFKVPEGASAPDAVAQLQQVLPKVPVDLNHRYVPLADPVYGKRLVGWRTDSATCSQQLRLGLIDSVIDRTNPVLRKAKIQQLSVLPAGLNSGPADHGTAVASILVGQGANGRDGLLPRAELVAINVFRQRDKKIDTTAEWLVRALDQAVAQHVSAINLSLGGPPNRILQHAVRVVWGRGIAIVSAAGNSGPNAQPVYPAAYPEVIAVTAIDNKKHVFEHANRGDYVELAAPGVYVWAAAPGEDDGKFVTGTSYAAPFVTAAWAALRTAYIKDTPTAVRARLAGGAVDLGAPGRDNIFGFGLLQWGVQCAQTAAK